MDRMNAATTSGLEASPHQALPQDVRDRPQSRGFVLFPGCNGMRLTGIDCFFPSLLSWTCPVVRHDG